MDLALAHGLRLRGHARELPARRAWQHWLVLAGRSGTRALESVTAPTGRFAADVTTATRDLGCATLTTMNREWKEATRRGDLEKVRRLLESGADIDARDEHGQTALMNAALAGQVELVRLLIERGAELNTAAKYNLSALMLSLIAHHTGVARLLIEAGADPDIQSSKNFYGKSALSLAEAGGHEDIVALLRERGAR